MPLRSSLFRNDSKLQACLKADSAHVVQGAKGPHVTRIQRALELIFKPKIDEADLTGARYGKSTAAAVLAYKRDRKIINRSYQKEADDIVGKMTIDKLDKELLELDKKSVVEKAYATIPEALAQVRSAKARLFAARSSYSPGSLFPDHPERRIVDWNFKAHRASDPVLHISRVLAIYDRMEQGLFFASHMRNKFDLFLFSPEFPQDPGAPAYTTYGGMDHGMADKDARGEYKKAIYFTPEFANKVFAASIVVHEFAHYCGGKEGSQTTIGHRASPRPAPRGRPLEDGSTDYAGMSAEDAFRNAQSYQCYCEPHTNGKPPAELGPSV